MGGSTRRIAIVLEAPHSLTVPTIREELEWLWHNKPCLQPSRKLGFAVLNIETRERGGFYYIQGLTLLVVTRGQIYPKWINKNFPPRRIRRRRLTVKTLKGLGYVPTKRQIVEINRIERWRKKYLPTSDESPTLPLPDMIRV
jgi:hypothetical protein